MSHTKSGNPSQSMKKQVDQVFFPGLEFEYVYDMDSSTGLVLQVLGAIEACPQKKVTPLMPTLQEQEYVLYEGKT